METVGPGIPGDGIHFPPSSIDLIAGVLTGDVNDIKSWTDGNFINIAEVAGTPGQELNINFLGIPGFRYIGLRMFYNGSATHWEEIQLLNLALAQFDIFKTFSLGLGYNYRYVDVPIRSADYIDTDNGNKVVMKVVHPSLGNAAHNSRINYAALIG